MKKYSVIAACFAIASLACAPAFAQNQSSTAPAAPGSSAQQPATSSTPQPPSTNPGQASTSQVPPHENLALSWLQDARVTLARLTEASMSQDARDALARVSTDFRAMYKAYTGEEPTEQKGATQAAMGIHTPDPTWEKNYTAMRSGIDRIVGPASGSTAGTTAAAVGTSGTTSAAAPSDASHMELTVPVRKDLVLLRDQMEHFKTAASKAIPH